MKKSQKNMRLSAAMEALGLNASSLSRQSGVDRTLISRWENGDRAITKRSKQVLPIAKTLAQLDTEDALGELLAPFQQPNKSKVQAICEYLTGEGFIAPPVRRTRQCEYIKQVRVLLGKPGFRRAALEMLEYVAALPPGREVVVLCQGRYAWITGNLPFVLQFLSRLRTAIGRDTRLLVINRRGYSIAETAAFALPWLYAHLKGYIRSRYYDGALPGNVRFVAAIAGSWRGRAEEDDEAPDNLYVETYTDPRDVRRDEALCDTYRAISGPASQYGFLQNPQGDGENVKLWKSGPLPGWKGEKADAPAPDKSFYALCRVPGFGIMTKAEFAQVAGGNAPPALPGYLFHDESGFSSGAYRIILCRENIREGLLKERRRHEALSVLLGRRAFIPRNMLRAQLERLLAAMKENDAFEVALLPRVAFEKLRLELICWKNSVSIGYLQDASESVFADDQATSGSFYGAIDYAWGKLLAGWKRKERVRGQLNRWIAGKDLEQGETDDSATVKNWDVLPK